MTVKRYEPGCAYVGEEEMIVASDGDYVSYEDYAELQRKVEAVESQLVDTSKNNSEMIAENVRQVCLLQQILTAKPGGVYFSKWEPLILSVLSDSVKTDAALEEARAQGVDGAIEAIIVHMNHQHVAVKGALHILKMYSEQLRKESGR